MEKAELLSVQNLSVSLSGKPILQDVSFTLREGDWLMLIGPNGAGKSTLINAISQAIPYSGQISVLGKDARHIKSRSLARAIGVLNQNHYVGYGFTVEEVIRLGLYSHREGFFSLRAPSKSSDNSAFGEAKHTSFDPDQAVFDAAGKTGLTELLSHSILTLSGGELQRTFLAQLFVQDPQILILDEPANHLDLIYQQQIFSLVKEWQSRPGRAVLSVVHDLSLAKKYGSRALLLRNGQTAALGTVSEVMSPELLESVYSMDVYAWMQDLYGRWSK